MAELEHARTTCGTSGTGAGRTPGGPFSDLVTVKLESCTSTWYFQPVRMRFRRTLKGLGVPGVTTGWRPYYGLRFGNSLDGFTVLLNPEGTRLLSARCHQAGHEVCEDCAEMTEDEASLHDTRQLVQ